MRLCCEKESGEEKVSLKPLQTFCLYLCNDVFVQNHALVCLKAEDLLLRLWVFLFQTARSAREQNEEQVCCDIKGHAVGGLHLSQLHSISFSPFPLEPHSKLYWSFYVFSLLFSVLSTLPGITLILLSSFPHLILWQELNCAFPVMIASKRVIQSLNVPANTGS